MYRSDFMIGKLKHYIASGYHLRFKYGEFYKSRYKGKLTRRKIMRFQIEPFLATNLKMIAKAHDRDITEMITSILEGYVDETMGTWRF